jgi:excisionase family DNA binding protein
MKKALTTTQAARLLGVSDQTIANWVDQGQLPAGRTGGGHRRIEPDDLVAFLVKQNLRVPIELIGTTSAILIVDDDPGVGQWMSRVIGEQHGHCRVLVAQDGYAAGEIVTAERPGIVILDLYMPGLDGFEVCRRIKSRPSTRDTVVIAITAHPSPDAERAILDAGAAVCLSKPISAVQLGQVLGGFLPQNG